MEIGQRYPILTAPHSHPGTALGVFSIEATCLQRAEITLSWRKLDSGLCYNAIETLWMSIEPGFDAGRAVDANNPIFQVLPLWLSEIILILNAVSAARLGGPG